MAALVDTNILVYRVDRRDPAKQRVAIDLIRRGLADGSLLIPHQALIEFVAATTRPTRGGPPILPRGEALHLAERYLSELPVVYPTEAVVSTALRGAALYGLAWYDAHLWAYAEVFGAQTIYSEDFEHERLYGAVRVIDPFPRRPSGRRPT